MQPSATRVARTKHRVSLDGLAAVTAIAFGLFLAMFNAPDVGGIEEESVPGKITTVLSGLNGPIDFAVAPDGAIWWNEYYTGNVTRYDPADGTREVLFHAEPIPDGVERGILGLALDPNVIHNRVFYVYYTVADPNDSDGGTNRLSRIENGAETILLTTSAHRMHNGGRILFVPDGTMFVSTGDNNRDMVAQDADSLLGKILHLHPDGKPAEGNLKGYVYSMGHRNVYGLAYDPVHDRLFATENSNAERDEVNLIVAGANYGWPLCEGHVEFDLKTQSDTNRPCTNSKFTAPIGEFTETGTVAPTGAAVVDEMLYWASWNQGAIHRMVKNPASDAWFDQVVLSLGGRINDLEADPKGSGLYYSNWTSIMRVGLPLAPVPTADEFPPDPPVPNSQGPVKGAPQVSLVLLLVTILFMVIARRATWRT